MRALNVFFSRSKPPANHATPSRKTAKAFRLGQRPVLDGMRAFAVLVVMAHHADQNKLRTKFFRRAFSHERGPYRMTGGLTGVLKRWPDNYYVSRQKR
jgi:hypothetical protein